MNFAKNLKKAMEEKNISQSELSVLTGISKSGISQYLSGKYEPKGKIISKLAETLGCSTESLMCSETENVMNNSNNVSVEEAAKLLGKSKQFVRVALQKGIVPFGFAVKMSSKYTYYISPKKLAEYVGDIDSES